MLTSSIDVQWYFVALVTAAIAISYFDRQTLPVAISAIQRTIPLERPAVLVAAVCVSHSLCGDVCSRWTDAGHGGNAPRIPSDHAVVVGGLRAAWTCDELWFSAGSSLPAGDGRGRRFSCGNQSSGGVDSIASAIDGDGNHQRRDGSGIGAGAAADRHRSADSLDGGWYFSLPEPWGLPG